MVNCGRVKLWVFVALAVAGGLSPAGADSASGLSELVDAAAQRLQVGDEVAALKWQTGAAIEDLARVRQQLAALADAARSENLDRDYVTRVFTDQIGATEAVEHYRFAQWKLDPASAPTAAPDLAFSRARIDGFNRVMLTQIGLQWEVLQSPACAGQLEEAKRDVSAARQLDDFYRQALSAATRDYCAR